MDISDQCRPNIGYPPQKTCGLQTCIWYIHATTKDNQRYPWHISNLGISQNRLKALVLLWYIPGISLVYAKTRKLINGYQIPDDALYCHGNQVIYQ